MINDLVENRRRTRPDCSDDEVGGDEVVGGYRLHLDEVDCISCLGTPLKMQLMVTTKELWKEERDAQAEGHPRPNPNPENSDQTHSPFPSLSMGNRHLL